MAERGPRTEAADNIRLYFPGYTSESLQNIDRNKLQRWEELANRANRILHGKLFSPAIQFWSSPDLIFPAEGSPTIVFEVDVAYKHHPYGGRNTIEITEETINGRKKSKVTFTGHTTAFHGVSHTTTKAMLGNTLQEVVATGRELGAPSDVMGHAGKHDVTYYPELLPQQTA